MVLGYQQVSSSYKIKMAEVGGLAKAMIQSVHLLEIQLIEKLWVLKVLQHLSTSGMYLVAELKHLIVLFSNRLCNINSCSI